MNDKWFDRFFAAFGAVWIISFLFGLVVWGLIIWGLIEGILWLRSH